jgi:excisionase family DNA binding protein
MRDHVSLRDRARIPALSADDEAVDIPGVKKTLKIGHTKTYELIRSGELPTFKIGNRRLTTRRILNEYIRKKLSELEQL